MVVDMLMIRALATQVLVDGERLPSTADGRAPDVQLVVDLLWSACERLKSVTRPDKAADLQDKLIACGWRLANDEPRRVGDVLFAQPMTVVPGYVLPASVGIVVATPAAGARALTFLALGYPRTIGVAQIAGLSLVLSAPAR